MFLTGLSFRALFHFYLQCVCSMYVKSPASNYRKGEMFSPLGDDQNISLTEVAELGLWHSHCRVMEVRLVSLH